MLSRIAQAPRLGLGHGSASRTVASLRLRPLATPTTVSPWVRTYAKKTPKQFLHDQNAASSEIPKSRAQGSPEAPSQEAAREAADATPNPTSSSDHNAATGIPKEEEPIPFHKLPDLTQGIPSTFEQEMNKEAGKSQSALEAVDQTSERERRERTEYVSTTDRNRQWWARAFGGATLFGIVFGVGYLGRNWDDSAEEAAHSDIPNGWSPLLWWQRARARMGESVSYYQEPAFEKLLPDPDPSFERPYTLCLSLDDLLVHSEWTREHGWRVAKRPGFDYFVRYLSQYYELVLFTTVPFAMGEPVMRKLDPFRLIMWPLYREATKFEEGEIVKVCWFLTPSPPRMKLTRAGPLLPEPRSIQSHHHRHRG